MKREPATAQQRRRAIVTGIVLAAIAVGIYATVILEYVLGK